MIDSFLLQKIMMSYSNVMFFFINKIGLLLVLVVIDQQGFQIISTVAILVFYKSYQSSVH